VSEVDEFLSALDDAGDGEWTPLLTTEDWDALFPPHEPEEVTFLHEEAEVLEKRIDQLDRIAALDRDKITQESKELKYRKAVLQERAANTKASIPFSKFDDAALDRRILELEAEKERLMAVADQNTYRDHKGNLAEETINATGKLALADLGDVTRKLKDTQAEAHRRQVAKDRESQLDLTARDEALIRAKEKNPNATEKDVDAIYAQVRKEVEANADRIHGQKLVDPRPHSRQPIRTPAVHVFDSSEFQTSRPNEPERK
jgi:hypothetical protein